MLASVSFQEPHLQLTDPQFLVNISKGLPEGFVIYPSTVALDQMWCYEPLLQLLLLSLYGSMGALLFKVMITMFNFCV